MGCNRPTEPLEVRFWNRVKRDPTGCWEWNGSIASTGYGIYQYERGAKDCATHRMAYRFANGEIPEGMHVCHSCDNRRCVRPSHLWLGTAADNVRDMFKKGRNRTVVYRGSKNPRAKLTEAALADILSNTDVSHADMARKYGVHDSHICKLRRQRYRWKHVS